MGTLCWSRRLRCINFGYIIPGFAIRFDSPAQHGTLKLFTKISKHNPPEQRRDNCDREIRTREDIAQGERYTLSSSIRPGKFPHEEI